MLASISGMYMITRMTAFGIKTGFSVAHRVSVALTALGLARAIF